jgi:hypothetical protein
MILVSTSEQNVLIAIYNCKNIAKLIYEEGATKLLPEG